MIPLIRWLFPSMAVMVWMLFSDQAFKPASNIFITAPVADSFANPDFIIRKIVFEDRYPFINYRLNYFSWKNASALSPFFSALSQANQRKVNILHIGDSHVQAGIFTGAVRDKLQAIFGNGGRGLIFPYAAGQTHSEHDYYSNATGKWTGARNVQPEPALDIGITGITARTTDKKAGFRITFNQLANLADSRRLRIYCKSDPAAFHLKIRFSENYDPIILPVYTGDTNQVFAETILPIVPQQIEVTMVADEPEQKFFECYGLTLDSPENKGIVYHSAGINGAGFNSIQRMNLFEYQLAALKPDLVVLDLGGNDFYGYGLNEDDFRARVEEVIGYIRIGAPNTAILLSCAQDMYRGRVNITAAREAAQLAKQIAYSNGCGFYNYFGAAGGPLSMQYWRRFQLAQSDRVHLTPAGYNYKAQLFYNALLTTYALALKDPLRSPEYFDSLPTPTFINPEKTMPPATPVRNNNATTEYYIVRSGDNLGKIARQFGITVAQLQAWNHLNTHMLKIGRRLVVSPPGITNSIDTANSQKNTPPPVTHRPVNTKPPVIIKKNGNNTKMIKYTIQKGDNFYNIAKKYGLTIDAIIQANPGANPNRLQIGDVILIPVQ